MSVALLLGSVVSTPALRADGVALATVVEGRAAFGAPSTDGPFTHANNADETIHASLLFTPIS